MTVHPTLLVRERTRVGEGPVWDAGSQNVCWLDILGCRLFRTDPESGTTLSFEVPTIVGAAAPRSAGGRVLATREGFATVTDDGAFDTRLTFLPDGHRMNDAAVDPRGRFVAGSCAMDFTDGGGRLHLLDTDWRTTVLLEDLALPNGLGWSPDGRHFYLADTMHDEVLVWDVDADTGLPTGGRQRFAAIASPDGMTIDVAGCLWVAQWGHGVVTRISPAGEVIDSIDLPVVQPSACAFGGQALDRLFVTSAGEGLDVDDDDLDGSLFVVDGLGVTGLPATPFGG